MSFAYDVKVELCSSKRRGKNCCPMRELYGILLFAGVVQPDRIKMASEHIYLAAHVVQLAERVLDVELGIDNREGSGIYTITIEGQQLQHVLDRMEETFWPDGITRRVDFTGLDRPCCRAAFLRGAFLQCGTISDPERGYHLELVTTHHKLGEDLLTLLRQMELPARMVKRKNNYVVYLKESEAIEDLLNIMGATQSAFALMDVKMVREVRNNINRQVNCDAANMAKTATASARQVQAIRRIEQLRGLESLPDPLLEVARLRLENPEMSLKEMGENLSEPISRHGVNHRMQKLLEIARELEEQEKAQEALQKP
ncbi:MAG: DNA-binding protein WhiA [Eubacteriales bacterium]|jgi:DNA-binding protein WhiA